MGFINTDHIFGSRLLKNLAYELRVARSDEHKLKVGFSGINEFLKLLSRHELAVALCCLHE